ncbi:MAG TPA: exosortase A, partial [Candidatus Eisenbacteria bacterium]
MGVPAETRAQSNATLWLLVAAVGLVTALLAGTAVSIVSIWHRSNTFGHGFLIPPIAAWLVWRRRSRIRAVPVRPCPWCLVGVALLGFAWFWGRLASVLILEQFAFALLIPATIAAVLGTAMLRALLFPLAFLMLGVPAGDALAVPLIEFTMSFTVKALQLSGVPVVRTGSFLTLPNGEWLVSDACSGFRYLVASFTLGCLYAHLKYRTWRYRLLFVALSLAIPIVANGVRAFLIVMLGYLSDMKLAMGVDHFIYGWVLFALFCLLLFWIGSRLREPAPPPRPGEPTPVDVRARAPVGRLVATAAA